MKVVFLLGLLIGSIIGAFIALKWIDIKLEDYQKTCDKRVELWKEHSKKTSTGVYQCGYSDGTRAVLFLQQTDTLTIEKYMDAWQTDSAKFVNEWIGEKL